MDEKQTVIWIGKEEYRLMVDPSVPQDMILFPDEKTRQWFNERIKENDTLDEACHQKSLEIIELKKAPSKAVQKIVADFRKKVK